MHRAVASRRSVLSALARSSVQHASTLYSIHVQTHFCAATRAVMAMQGARFFNVPVLLTAAEWRGERRAGNAETSSVNYLIQQLNFTAQGPWVLQYEGRYLSSSSDPLKKTLRIKPGTKAIRLEAKLVKPCSPKTASIHGRPLRATSSHSTSSLLSARFARLSKRSSEKPDTCNAWEVCLAHCAIMMMAVMTRFLLLVSQSPL